MPSPPDPSDLIPAERTRAIARVLAAGLLRLAESPPEPPQSSSNPVGKNLSDLSLNCLELPRETRLNVHTS
jgi:hypothetical protein